MTGILQHFGARTLRGLQNLGRHALFFAELSRHMPGALSRFYLIVAQIYAIGNRSMVIIAASGLAVGFVLGMSPTAEFVLSPYILALQIAPKVAFAPLFVIWFGYTVYPKILVAVLIVFFPVMINVLGAVRAIDPDIVRLARSFSASRLQVLWKIEFPASLPPLFAGLRIGSTLAVVGVVVGELVGGNIGLGYLLSFGEGQANTPMVFVTILMLTLVGCVAYLLVILIEQRVLHYMPKRALGDF